MPDYTLRMRWVSLNSPKNRVRKGKDGLWHVYQGGWWFGSFGSWDRAITAAADGRIVIGGSRG